MWCFLAVLVSIRTFGLKCCVIKSNNVRAVKCTSKTSECRVDIFAIKVDSLDNIRLAGPDGSNDGLVTQPHVSVCVTLALIFSHALQMRQCAVDTMIY